MKRCTKLLSAAAVLAALGCSKPPPPQNPNPPTPDAGVDQPVDTDEPVTPTEPADPTTEPIEPNAEGGE